MSEHGFNYIAISENKEEVYSVGSGHESAEDFLVAIRGRLPVIPVVILVYQVNEVHKFETHLSTYLDVKEI